MHYATFKMAYLSAKKALMTFRITIHFSGSCFSPEVLGSLSEKCDFQHTPHIPLQHTNTALIYSVLKSRPLSTKPSSFGEQDIKKWVSNTGIPGRAVPSKFWQKSRGFSVEAKKALSFWYNF